MPDYSEHLPETTSKQFDRLNELVTLLRGYELGVAIAEEGLKKAKGCLVDIAENQLPALMKEMGLAEFTTLSGLKAKMVNSVFANISKARQAEAMTWLDENGHGGLIKSSVALTFNRGESEQAQELAAELAQRGFSTKANEAVHSSTLRSWAAGLLEAGEEFPLELFGVHQKKIVKIST